MTRFWCRLCGVRLPWFWLAGAVVMILALATRAAAESEVHKVLIRDVTTVEGVRDNSLIGYGLVVGLKGTGDRATDVFHGANTGQHPGAHGGADPIGV